MGQTKAITLCRPLDCHSARPFSDHSHPHAAGLTLWLSEQCIFSLWKSLRLSVFGGGGNSTVTHACSAGESEALSSSKDQAFFTPYQYEKPVASKWFPKPQVICLCLSPWLHLQDSKIKRTCCSSKMSSKCLNSSAVIKYSSMDVSARVPAESRRTGNHWCLLYTVIKVNEWNKIRGN